MPDISKCRRCNAPIYWHKSRSGKNYPCNSEDRKDFHQCSETAKPQPSPPPKQAAALSTQPASPANHIERRLQWLESEVRGLLIRMEGFGN